MATTPTPKNEVTKVLALSLDKISKSKRTRFGPNLRRSLLVQSVLYKAKDIYVSEVKNKQIDNHNSSDSPMENGDDHQSESDSQSETQTDNFSSSKHSAPVRRQFSSQSSVVEEQCETEEATTSDDEDSESEPMTRVVPFSRFISSPVISSDSLADNIIDELATNSETETSDDTPSIDKENNPPTTTNTSLSCGRCLKRRSSTVHDVSTNSTTNSISYIPSKRLRTNSIDHSSSDIIIASDSAPYAMDTAPSPINSLVKIFSESFMGLTSSDMVNQSQYEKTTQLNTFSLSRDSIAITA